MLKAQQIKGRIISQGLSVSKVSEMLGINKSTMYKKLKDDGETFTIKEVRKLSEILKLSLDDVNRIFFNQ